MDKLSELEALISGFLKSTLFLLMSSIKTLHKFEHTDHR